MKYETAGRGEEEERRNYGTEDSLERLRKYTYILPSGRRVMVVLDDEVEPAGTAR